MSVVFGSMRLIDTFTIFIHIHPDTGRRSIPEFQVMNLETLRKQKKRKKSMRALREPRPVLYHAGCRRQEDDLGTK